MQNSIIFSLPKSHRLHKADEFSAVIRFRCIATGDFLQIYAKPNNTNYSRLGLIVAKKVARRAVDRNRVKRLLREFFRVNQHSQVTLNMDWVIRLRRPITRDDTCRLTEEAKTLMLQLQQCHE